jgi:hypothetical protein
LDRGKALFTNFALWTFSEVRIALVQHQVSLAPLDRGCPGSSRAEMVAAHREQERAATARSRNVR